MKWQYRVASYHNLNMEKHCKKLLKGGSRLQTLRAAYICITQKRRALTYVSKLSMRAVTIL